MPDLWFGHQVRHQVNILYWIDIHKFICNPFFAVIERGSKLHESYDTLFIREITVILSDFVLS